MRALFFTLSIVAISLAADAPKSADGFAPLFNGKDLTGWKLKKGGDSLKDKTDATGKRFTVAEGTITVDGKVKGDITIETDKAFEKDVTIRFEFKPGKGCNNDLFLRGTKFDIKAADIKNLKTDEWNTFEIAIKSDTAEFKCNGEAVKSLKTKPGATAFGLRAEAGPIQFRKLEAKE